MPTIELSCNDQLMNMQHNTNKQITVVILSKSLSAEISPLSKTLAEILPCAVSIVVGQQTTKASNQKIFFEQETDFDSVKNKFAKYKYLIIESRSVLNNNLPELYIIQDSLFDSIETLKIPGQDQSIIRSDQLIPQREQYSLAQRLEIELRTVRAIIWLSGARPEPISGIILKGGKSSRMGCDKSLLEIEGIPLIKRIYNFFAGITDEVLLSLALGDTFSMPNTKIVSDLEANRGPLMGIYSSLSSIRTSRAFILACDIPYINPWIVRQLLYYSDEYQIVVPSFKKGRAEPLFGIYHSSVANIAKQLLDSGVSKISALFDLCNTKILYFPDIDWYHNLNTREDYEKLANRKI